MKAVEYIHGRYTSGSANLDNMIATGKAVILCETHNRKFQPAKARYRPHPQKNLRRVTANCDVCRAFEPFCFMYLNEKDAYEEQKKLEKFQRTLEYGTFGSS